MTQKAAVTDRRGPVDAESRVPQFDAIVVGAGITGIYQAYRLREIGLKVFVLEAGDGVGGVWHWNRYPNARFDSESYSYAYLFNEELFNDWEWSEKFAGQPEIERYLNHVVDRFEMRDLFQFRTRVRSARFDDGSNTWAVETEAGEQFTSRFVVACLGMLSAPIYPQAPGLETFEGIAHHTGRWPKEGIDFAGKRVAVIGTGASGVGVIPAIAREAESLTVFQRTATWATPLNNAPITPEEHAEIRALGRTEYHASLQETFGGFIHKPVMTSVFEVDEATRDAHFEEVYRTPGLGKMIANYMDIGADPQANEVFTEFVANKIRPRIKDPELAKKLIPSNHGFGTKRPPMEDGYYEVFNEPHVRLVDLTETPIEEFGPAGLRTSTEDFGFDVIVLATGYDFGTGSYTRIDFQGVGGHTLAEHWAKGPRTHMGVLLDGFPNLFISGGPHSTTGNMPRSTEILADLVADILRRGKDENADRIETDKQAEDLWTDRVYAESEGYLLHANENFFTGANVPGKARAFLAYTVTTLAAFRTSLLEARGADFEHIRFHKPAA